MKFVETRDDVHVAGAQTVEAFTIKASAKAFQILSANLYSNPVGSMIRELSTNAYDAHIMVGKKDEPFVITLPNSLEPTFKIRDFGPGLSEQSVFSIYTTFFESTKTESNDMVGCLGLGSKSPFGVADSFTITSYHGGTKTIYSAFLNDARIPSIAKFASFPSDEENGLEIEVAVNEDNFRTFNKEVNNQLKYFKVKPIIRGNSDFAWHPNEEYLYEGTGWKMVAGGNGPRVVQGQIQYPINTRDMGKIYDNASLAVQELLNRSVLFEVAIGDVNIAPSREALSYDDRTSRNIVASAEKILLELPVQIRKAIEACETEYDAKIKYSMIISDLTRGYNRGAIAKAVKESGEIKWNGRDVSSTDIEFETDEIESAIKFTKNYRGRFQKNIYHLYGAYDGTRHWEFQATDLKHTVWIYATSDDRAVEARTKQFIDTRGRDVLANIIYTKKTPEELAEGLGLKPEQLILASSLAKVQRAKTGNGGKKSGLTVAVFDVDSYSKADQWVNEEVNDFTELEGFYVNLDRFNVMKADNHEIVDFKAFVRGAIELGLITSDDEIYGLRTLNQKRKHNLVNLFDHITDASKKISLNAKYEFGNSVVTNKFSNSLTECKNLKKFVNQGSPAIEVIDAVIAANTTTYSVNARKVINDMGLKPAIVNMQKQAAALDTLYPMISQIGYYINAADVGQYINQMDLLRQLVAAKA